MWSRAFRWYPMVWRTAFHLSSKLNKSHTRRCQPSETSQWGPQILHYNKVRAIPSRHGGEAALPTLDSGVRSDGWSTPRAGRFTPGKEARYPLCRRIVGSLWMCLDSHASTEVQTPERVFVPTMLSRPSIVRCRTAFSFHSTYVGHLVGKQAALFPVDTVEPHIQWIMGTLFPQLKQTYREGDITFSTRRKNECDYVTANFHTPSWRIEGHVACTLTSPSAWICKAK
jgi:hypothetical protein